MLAIYNIFLTDAWTVLSARVVAREMMRAALSCVTTVMFPITFTAWIHLWIMCHTATGSASGVLFAKRVALQIQASTALG